MSPIGEQSPKPASRRGIGEQSGLPKIGEFSSNPFAKTMAAKKAPKKTAKKKKR